MSRRLISTFWDRITRNNINDNFEELYSGIGNISGKITDEIYDEIRNSVNLNWKEPVDVFDDLPSGAETGDTRMTRGNGTVYRYDGSRWIEIQKFNPDAINEVDNRLQAEIDKKETPEAAQAKADKAENNATDYADQLEGKVFGDSSDVVKIVERVSNDNGQCIRWSDGRQECFMEVSQNASEKTGGIYKSNSTTINFPKNFDSKYPIHVGAQVLSINRWANATTARSSTVNVMQYSSINSGESSFKTQVYAVGRWK
jgi:hypothetical protein